MRDADARRPEDAASTGRAADRFEEERRLYDEVRTAVHALSDDLSAEVLEKLRRRTVTPEALRAMVREEVRSALEDARPPDAGGGPRPPEGARRAPSGPRSLGPTHLLLALCLATLLILAGWFGGRILGTPASADGDVGPAAVPTDGRPTPTGERPTLSSDPPSSGSGAPSIPGSDPGAEAGGGGATEDAAGADSGGEGAGADAAGAGSGDGDGTDEGAGAEPGREDHA